MYGKKIERDISVIQAWGDGIFLSLDAKELALVFRMASPSLPSPNPLQTTWGFFFLLWCIKCKSCLRDYLS